MIRIQTSHTPDPGLRLLAAILACGLVSSGTARAQQVWAGHGANPQHTALSAIPGNPLTQILWQTPVDLQPQFSSGGELLAHYGCPLVTRQNTVLVPVKTGTMDFFRVEAHHGGSGLLLWQYASDYTLPTHSWLPPYSPALTPAGRLYIPGAGGTVLYTSNVDTTGVPTFKRVAFYGNSLYAANTVVCNSDIQICTPLTSDSLGNIYFGYRAGGLNPLGFLDGIARISPNDSAVYVGAATAAATAGATVPLNCAPALSNRGDTLYIAIRKPSTSNGFLVALDAATLVPRVKVSLVDPRSGSQAVITNNATSSPMVAPDGTVYFGVLEAPILSNNERGWLLAFTSALAPAGVPGAFGWDDTPSLVPAAMVPSYHGGSSYLLATKYNNYAGVGTGNGINKLAVLDPHASQPDPVTLTPVMKEILTIAGTTPDSDAIATYPNAVKEWCVNSIVVDPATHSLVAGNEDGRLYRWDLSTNTLSESITLTAGLGAAYTPTAIGKDGSVYAINNATLFAVGSAPVSVGSAGARPALALGRPQPNPFTRATSLRFSLPKPGRATLEIFDLQGRRVARLLEGILLAGDHAATWDGRSENGAACAAGVYLARLGAGDATTTRRLVLVH